MQLIDTLKRFNAENHNLDEMIELSAQARILRTEYENLQVDVPEWLARTSTAIRRGVAMKVQDELDRKISEARARRSSLATAEEKRQALDAELQKLEDAKKALAVS